MLMVKPGKEYVLGGKVYRGGDVVEGVPGKFVRILTGPKGPLMSGDPDQPPPNPTDLPKAVAPVVEPEPDIPLSASQSYQTRHMEAAGLTGEEPSPASSRPARPRKVPASKKPKDAAG